jgi:hypothetical protein
VAGIVRPVSLGAEGEEHSTDVVQIARPGDLTDLVAANALDAARRRSAAPGPLCRLQRHAAPASGSASKPPTIGTRQRPSRTDPQLRDSPVRDLKRVNAHLVEAAAYPVLKSQGELLPTRLRPEE